MSQFGTKRRFANVVALSAFDCVDADVPLAPTNVRFW